MNNIELNKLAEKAKTDMNARWKLGQILYEAEKAGKIVSIDKSNGIIMVKEIDK